MTNSNGAAERAETDVSQVQVKEQAQAALTREVQMARIEDQIRNEVRREATSITPPKSALTDEERIRIAERAEIEAWDLMRLVEGLRRDVGGRTEEELIAEAPRNPQIRQPLELTRRLIDSNRKLQDELIRSRESSERVAADLGSKMTELTNELTKFRTSSDRLAERILWWSRAVAALTIVLVIGTGMLIYLTMVLVQRTPSNPAVSTPPASHASSTNHPATPIRLTRTRKIPQ